MREYHVAATIIQQSHSDNPNSYVVHRGQLSNGELGKLTVYEGGIRDDESFAHAASRLLQEKSGLFFKPEDFTWRDYVVAESEMPSQNILLEVEVFTLNLPHGFSVDSLKNSLLKSERDIAKARLEGELTRLASAAFAKVVGV
jgi:hypothetical protein